MEEKIVPAKKWMDIVIKAVDILNRTKDLKIELNACELQSSYFGLNVYINFTYNSEKYSSSFLEEWFNKDWFDETNFNLDSEVEKHLNSDSLPIKPGEEGYGEAIAGAKIMCYLYFKGKKWLLI